MREYRMCLLLAIFFLTHYAKPIKSQEPGDPVAKALAEGEALRKQRDYDRALSAYRKADKLSHHTCADCFIQERDSEGILELKTYLAAPGADPKSRLEARWIIFSARSKRKT